MSDTCPKCGGRGARFEPLGEGVRGVRHVPCPDCTEVDRLRHVIAEAHTACSTIGAAARIAMTKDEAAVRSPQEALVALKRIATTAYQTRDKLDQSESR